MRALVLFSGGLDSAVTLVKAIHSGRDCEALFFSYGQRNLQRELAAAKALTGLYGVPLHVQDLILVTAPLAETMQNAEQKGWKSVYVPCRNTIFMATAYAWAEVHDASEIWLGLMAGSDDSPVVAPDSNPEFVLAVEAALQEGSEKRAEFVTPYIYSTKAEVVREALELGVPVGLSWSCYTGDAQPCGRCPACFERIRAGG